MEYFENNKKRYPVSPWIHLQQRERCPASRINARVRERELPSSCWRALSLLTHRQRVSDSSQSREFGSCTRTRSRASAASAARWGAGGCRLTAVLILHARTTKTHEQNTLGVWRFLCLYHLRCLFLALRERFERGGSVPGSPALLCALLRLPSAVVEALSRSISSPSVAVSQCPVPLLLFVSDRARALSTTD